MEKLEEYANGESRFTERSNSKREPIQEEITNHSFELLQTVKELRTEMETVKKENERILRAQEELNQTLMENFQNEEKDKRTESEDIPYQHKNKNYRQSKFKSSSSFEIYGDPHKKNYQYTSDSSKDNHHTRKRKFKPYEEISGEFKKIKPPTFNGETKKGEEVESWLSRMKKYFQIYNYSNQLKSRMAIYILTGKADIWWQDLK